jgi:heme-degrading monooxygenase HmoA
MSDPIVSIVGFNGDPDDLVERFERARRLWIEAQDDGYRRPAFYAACKTDDGIVVVSGWETAADHKAFGRRLGPHLEAVGMGRPDHHEHMSIEKLGWDSVA